LEITIRGEPFAHLLFHAVLTYSNWQWIRICHSESLLALRRERGQSFDLGKGVSPLILVSIIFCHNYYLH